MTKVILITGGSSGIGKCMGEFLSQKGYIVYGTSRHPERYSESIFPLLQLDMKDTASIQNTVAEILKREKRLDILINNAGAGITGPIEEIPDAQMASNFETNCLGPIKVIKAVLPQMRLQQSGLIINITSIAAYMGLPYRGGYSASKGALLLITEAFRMELKGFNIQMTNVAPGDFATNIAAGRYHAPLTAESPYREAYGKTLELMNAHVNAGAKPERMAQAVYKIIRTKKPKVHYKVGAFMERFSLTIKFLLPSKWYEQLLMRHYNL